jgi:hypothetical protein
MRVETPAELDHDGFGVSIPSLSDKVLELVYVVIERPTLLEIRRGLEAIDS